MLTMIAASSSVQLFLAGAAPRMSAENMSGAAITANKLNLCVRDRMRPKRDKVRQDINVGAV